MRKLGPNWLKLKAAKNKVTSAIRNAKQNYFKNTINENRNDAEHLWNTLKSLSGNSKKPNTIQQLDVNGEHITSSHEIAETLNRHFTGLASELLGSTSSTELDSNKLAEFVLRLNPSQSSNLTIPAVIVKEVEQLIRNIASDKATGADGVSIRLLKMAAPAIAPSLTKLVNHCISAGSFPTLWKTAKIISLHKGGDRSDKNKYRPISLLPLISKVLERHMHNAIYAFLKENKLIYKSQYGFRKQHSTETALINIVDRLLQNIDDNKVNGLVFAMANQLLETVLRISILMLE